MTGEGDLPTLWLELGRLASDLAVEAGQVVLELRSNGQLAAWTKSSATDLVTEADRAVEELITAGILAARPDDSILGEEGARNQGPSPVVWHIDPIDGTTNYVYGISAFAVSIAAEIDGEVVAGAVYHPPTGELYRAVLNGGAYLGDAPLSGSGADNLSAALVATGFGYEADQRRQQGEVVAQILPQVRDIRRMGSAALDLCAVAAGQVDAYYERGLNWWDLAAGSLVASEAGAVVQNLRGGKPDTSFVLAAGPGIFGPLRQILADLQADGGP